MLVNTSVPKVLSIVYCEYTTFVHWTTLHGHEVKSSTTLTRHINYNNTLKCLKENIRKYILRVVFGTIRLYLIIPLITGGIYYAKYYGRWYKR